MTIDNNFLILPVDVIVPWSDPVYGIKVSAGQIYSENVLSCNFDGAIDTWETAPTRASYVTWIPTTDVRLTAIVVNIANLGGTASDTVTFKISSAAQGTLATVIADVTADATSPSNYRTYATTTYGGSTYYFASGVTTITAGDTVTLSVSDTTSTTAIEKCRLHLVYESFWSKS